MACRAGYSTGEVLRFDLDRRLKRRFHGAVITGTRHKRIGIGHQTFDSFAAPCRRDSILRRAV
jgi:hypothetical protein